MKEKKELIAKVLDQLRDQYDRTLAAGRSAEEYATDAESRAEDKYDTRSLEASYLAAGQAQKVKELAEAIQRLDAWDPPSFSGDEPIDAGALVEADLDGELVFYLLAPAGGGLATEHLGCELTVLTPDSPLAAQLIGKRAGDRVADGKITIYGVE
jgi:transcription elongation GreA/GreB family factor